MKVRKITAEFSYFNIWGHSMQEWYVMNFGTADTLVETLYAGALCALFVHHRPGVGHQCILVMAAVGS